MEDVGNGGLAFEVAVPRGALTAIQKGFTVHALADCRVDLAD